MDITIVIDGNTIDKIRNVRFGMQNRVDDHSTQGAGSTRNRLIEIVRAHDAQNFFWEWAVSAVRDNRKNGKITFNEQDQVVLEAEFTNGFVHKYWIKTQERALGSQAMEIRETILISAEVLSLGSVENSDEWNKA